MTRLMSVRSVAAACDLSVRKIYQLVATGAFPRQTYIGGQSRWSSDEVERWIAVRLGERDHGQQQHNEARGAR